ncbi:hypothetical protein IJT10_00805 [bacterium]|nr:hypothetical protein [bacterium]
MSRGEDSKSLYAEDLWRRLISLVLVILFSSIQLAGWLHPHAHGLTKELSYLFDLQNFYGTTFCEHIHERDHYESTDTHQSCQEDCTTCLNILQLHDGTVPEEPFNLSLSCQRCTLQTLKIILQTNKNNLPCRSPPSVA